MMYFPEKRVAALLRELAGFARPPAEVLFSFMERRSDGAISFEGGRAVIGWWLRLRREPFLWGIARPALPGFLQSAGLRLMSATGHEDLRAQILAPLGLARLSLARGESLGRCCASSP